MDDLVAKCFRAKVLRKKFLRICLGVGAIF